MSDSKDGMNGKMWEGTVLRLGWGKPLPKNQLDNVRQEGGGWN